MVWKMEHEAEATLLFWFRVQGFGLRIRDLGLKQMSTSHGEQGRKDNGRCTVKLLSPGPRTLRILC